MRKIKKFSSSGPGLDFTCIFYEDYTPPISKPNSVPFVEGDIIGVEVDFSAGKCRFFKNGKEVVCK